MRILFPIHGVRGQLRAQNVTHVAPVQQQIQNTETLANPRETAIEGVLCRLTYLGWPCPGLDVKMCRETTAKNLMQEVEHTLSILLQNKPLGV